ncbi:hypothetical protein LguiA_001052 [Lonicera macranthoides]
MAYNNNKEKLLKVGMEGFAMVDECYGRKAAKLNTPQRSPPPPRQLFCRYQCQYQPQESHVYVVTHLPSSTKDVSAVDSYEAAKIYGGTLIEDYPTKKTTRVAYY